jgi:dihydroorotase
MKRLLKGGRVIDPANGIDGAFDILIEDGKIARVERNLPVPGGDVQVVEVASGLVVCPGLIDMHVHLREPGQEHKETIATGTKSAVAGGFTAVACMPNTSPINDSAATTELILKKAAEAGLARVYPIGAVSRGSNGEYLADIAELHAAGCAAISDDGRPVATALLMRRALEYASMFSLPVIAHEEDPTLVAGGVMNEGWVATRLGLAGWPAVAEASLVARDALLAEMTRARLHVAHVSTRESLDLLRRAKQAGCPVTCEATPHHLTLTDVEVARSGYDTRFKMNPPLRSERDREALVDALVDGTLDAIATDHAPHHRDEKALEFADAPFGVTGLETALAVLIDALVAPKLVSLGRLVEALTIGPARALGLAAGTLREGAPADVVLFSTTRTTTVEASRFASRSHNSPWLGRTLKGRVERTFVAGREVFRAS